MNTFQKTVRDAASEANLSVRERVKLRLVLRFAPDRLEQEILNQAQVEGVMPANLTLAMMAEDSAQVTAIDWKALAEFIKEVLPAILQIIALFL